MRSILPICFAATLAGVGPGAAEDFTLTPPTAEVVARDLGDVVPGTDIVVILEGLDAADRLRDAAEAEGYAAGPRHQLPGLGLILARFEVPPGIGPLAAIAALEALEPGVTAGVNHAYRPEPAAARAQVRSYAGKLIAWPDEGCRAAVPIGVIDGDLTLGLDPLAGADVVRADFTERAGAATHGAAIAELLVGHGRLREARLYHATVVGELAGSGPAAGVDAIMRAVDWLAEQGVRHVNISLAGPYNKILDRGLQAAVARGMILIAAAGNDGPGSPPRYPAAFDGTIAVTAVDAALRAYKGAPEGPHIDVAAPGVDVFIASAGEGRYMSGTSLAAPFVTAAIAADPAAAKMQSAEELRGWLAGQSRDLGAPGYDPLFGAGLIQTGSGCQ